MDISVYGAVLVAAVLHGTWNMLVKINLDRFAALFVIHSIMGVMGLAALSVTGLPAAAALPYALVSGTLHTLYNLFLARAYRYGEMSLVYPLARGVAPLVALLLSLVIAGETISLVELVLLGLLLVGLWLVALGGAGKIMTDSKSIAYAIGTAIFIGLYTVVDGMGARLSEDAFAFIALIYFFDGLFILIVALFTRGTAIFTTARPFAVRGAIGALFAAAAYGLVVWAMTKAPIAIVAALRETSILFVLAMSAFVLKERVAPVRILGGALIVAAAAALRFA